MVFLQVQPDDGLAIYDQIVAASQVCHCRPGDGIGGTHPLGPRIGSPTDDQSQHGVGRLLDNCRIGNPRSRARVRFASHRGGGTALSIGTCGIDPRSAQASPRRGAPEWPDGGRDSIACPKGTSIEKLTAAALRSACVLCTANGEFLVGRSEFYHAAGLSCVSTRFDCWHLETQRSLRRRLDWVPLALPVSLPSTKRTLAKPVAHPLRRVRQRPLWLRPKAVLRFFLG